MKRCPHNWRPLITLPPDLPESLRLKLAFALAMEGRLGEIDRCTLCGRLSDLTHSRARRRQMYSNPWIIERLLKRAAEFQAWLDRELATKQ